MAKKSINLHVLNYDIGNFIELVLRAGYKRYRKNLLDLFDKLRITEMSKVEIRKKREREKERKRERKIIKIYEIKRAQLLRPFYFINE